jgi:hypothetical protein
VKALLCHHPTDLDERSTCTAITSLARGILLTHSHVAELRVLSAIRPPTINGQAAEAEVFFVQVATMEMLGFEALRDAR